MSTEPDVDSAVNQTDKILAEVAGMAGPDYDFVVEELAFCTKAQLISVCACVWHAVRCEKKAYSTYWLQEAKRKMKLINIKNIRKRRTG